MPFFWRVHRKTKISSTLPPGPQLEVTCPRSPRHSVSVFLVVSSPQCGCLMPRTGGNEFIIYVVIIFPGLCGLASNRRPASWAVVSVFRHHAVPHFATIFAARRFFCVCCSCSCCCWLALQLVARESSLYWVLQENEPAKAAMMATRHSVVAPSVRRRSSGSVCLFQQLAGTSSTSIIYHTTPHNYAATTPAVLRWCCFGWSQLVKLHSIFKHFICTFPRVCTATVGIVLVQFSSKRKRVDALLGWALFWEVL